MAAMEEFDFWEQQKKIKLITIIKRGHKDLLI